MYSFRRLAFPLCVLLLICTVLVAPLRAQSPAAVPAFSESADILTPGERVWLEQNQARLALAVETDYAPFVFLDAKDQMTGMAHDYLRLVETKIGVRFAQRRSSSLDDAFAQIRSGQAQLVNAVTPTRWRSEFLFFTSPVISLPNVIIVRKDDSAQMTERDLAGRVVALVKSYASTEYLNARNLGLVAQLVPDDLSALLDVSFGRADATVVDLASATYLIEHKGITNLRVAGEIGAGIELAIGSTKTEPMLHRILQKGLNAISQDEAHAIRDRWINHSDKILYLDLRLWLILAGISLVALITLAATLLWNRMLRRQVSQRTVEYMLANAEIRRDHQFQMALHRISETSHATNDLADLLRQIHQIVGELMSANNFFVALYDEISQEISFPYFIDENDPVPAARKIGQGGLTETVLRTGMPLLLTQEMVRSGSQAEPSGVGTQSVDWLGVPLKTGQRTVGVLAVQSYSGQVRFTDKDKKLLEFVADQVAMTIQRKQAESANFESANQLRLIYDTANVAIFNLDAYGVITHANRYMAEMFSCSLESLVGIEYVALLSPSEREVAKERIGQLLSNEISTIDLERQYLRHDGSEFWGHVKALRKLDAEGKLIGEVAVIVDITERKQAESQIQALAFSDPLTGLPNRRLLMDRLEHAMAAASRHLHQNALLFVDLDDFKTINDTLGHDQGDLLLIQVAHRLVASVREGDTVARLGGDEFIVLLEDLTGNPQEAAEQAQLVTSKIHTALGQPCELKGHWHHSSASIGVTLFGGTARENIEEPLKRAELAMYQAKKAGRNTFRFFEPAMRTAVNTRATLEADLRQGVTAGQFLLYYQPQCRGDGKMAGVEALLRWQHPERGLVSPAEFIPIAEACGLILPLGRWVLKAACKQLAAWSARPEMAGLTMSVNVSAREFRQADFVEAVVTILEATGANPTRLKLELTESVLVDNVEDIIFKMNTLKSNRVGFSLDDFGTGYSSLSYLKRLPLDQLKIDQGFVRDILSDANDAAIAKMVVVLAATLGLTVIAEGVETEAQLWFLGSLGCDIYQGYYFSRPLPIDEFEDFARGR